MSYHSINGLIAYYDLRNLIFDSSKDRHVLVYEDIIERNIKISIFNNFYYYLDFSECSLEYLKPKLNHQTIDDFDGGFAINLQREFINALNALIHIEASRNNQNVLKAPNIKRFEMPNDVDQFIIPNTKEKEIHSLERFLDKINCFSSRSYQISCDAILRSEPTNQKFNLELVKKALSNLNLLLKRDCIDYNTSPFYILSNLWKINSYMIHDLCIDATVKLRSIFEVLVKRKFPAESKKSELEKYCGSKEISEFFINFQNLRNESVHELSIPKDKRTLVKCFEHLIQFFHRDFDLDISNILK